jgi:ribosomal protein L4
MHARSDFAHAAAVDAILRAHRLAPTQSAGEDSSHHSGGPLWGRGLAAVARSQSLRVPHPQSGGC